MTSNTYDVVIIGGGPAGLTAAIYSSRDELSTLLLERAFPGGLMAQAINIENFPGFHSISGYELAEKMLNQAKNLGTKIENGLVTNIEVANGEKTIALEDGRTVKAKVVIIAGGSSRRKLLVPGEDHFIGRGVSYCATCDGAFYKERTVAIIGGGNSALSEALHLAAICKKVYLVHRRDAFRGTSSLQEQVKKSSKIEIIFNSEVKAINGNVMSEELVLHNNQTKTDSTLKIDGIFISIGLVPQTDYLKNLLQIDSNGAIVVDVTMQTNVPGIYAAGDIRSQAIQQAISAAGDGATAAYYAQIYLGSFCQSC